MVPLPVQQYGSEPPMIAKKAAAPRVRGRPLIAPVGELPGTRIRNGPRFRERMRAEIAAPRTRK